MERALTRILISSVKYEEILQANKTKQKKSLKNKTSKTEKQRKAKLCTKFCVGQSYRIFEEVNSPSDSGLAGSHRKKSHSCFYFCLCTIMTRTVGRVEWEGEEVTEFGLAIQAATLGEKGGGGGFGEGEGGRGGGHYLCSSTKASSFSGMQPR